MKILLVRPRPPAETIGLRHFMICEPLELEYLCAGIADLGHETLIVDMILEQRRLDDLMREHNPDVIGITAYITHVDIAKNYCRIAKSWKPECHTIVGGVHAEVVPEDFSDANIDYVVTTNGVSTFRQIIESLTNKRDTAGGPGVWSPTKPRPTTNPSFDFPPPDRSKVARYRNRYYYLFHNPCALIKTSFGCPFHCSFCFCREITAGQYFTRSLDSVLDELHSIPERDIYIVDDNFLVSRDRVLEFCRRLRKQDSDKRFLIYGRADFICENEDVIAEFADCGLRAVIVGLESCNPDELRKYNKKNDPSTNEAAVRILSRYDIDCYATLIMGMDWNSADFSSLYLIFINLQPLTPLPGTAIFRQYQDQLLVPREDFGSWDLAHLALAPTRISIAAYYWNIIKLYYKVTMRPANILRLLKKYGIKANFRMLLGSTQVTIQYLGKFIRALHLIGRRRLSRTTIEQAVK
jgi:radical SAM superfamily enzyme YgiQ (UPF0313 family)